MGKRICALALAIVGASAAFSQSVTHTVAEGETLSTIANRYSVDTIHLAHANAIKEIHRLKLGQKIYIPEKLRPKIPVAQRNSYFSAQISGTSGVITQVCLLGYLAQTLPSAPAVAKKAAATSAKPVAKGAAGPKLASNAKVDTNKLYRVVSGDNDWVIARKLGTKPSLVRGANPKINWARLQIGQVLNLPNGATKPAKLASGLPVIRTRHAVIERDGVNIRRNPNTNAAVVTTVSRGLPVTILDREGDWYKLRFPKGTVGWVRGDMLKASTAASGRVAKKSSSTKSTTRSNYRSNPKVAYSPKTGNAVVDNALAMLGTRYSYGSASRSATDCSGLTTQAYRKEGVKLPRTSRQQAKVGAPVSKSSLKPGDLVFFHTGRSKRINHVGIYKGNGKFVHASSAKGRVREDSLSDGYYSNRYAGARRPVVPKSKSTSAAKAKTVAKSATASKKPSSKPIGEHKGAEGEAGAQ